MCLAASVSACVCHWLPPNQERALTRPRACCCAARAAVAVNKVGCGVGNSVFPLLELNPQLRVYACDFSPTAVQLVQVRTRTCALLSFIRTPSSIKCPCAAPTRAAARALPAARSFLQAHPQYAACAGRVRAFVADITSDSLSAELPGRPVDFCSMVFVLSAVAPAAMPQVHACADPPVASLAVFEQPPAASCAHAPSCACSTAVVNPARPPAPPKRQALRNVASVLKPGAGRVLFRDYAAGDLAQSRLDALGRGAKLISERFYVRGDGTCCYYYTEVMQRRIASFILVNGFVFENRHGTCYCGDANGAAAALCHSAA